MSIIIFLWKLIIRIPRRFHGAKLFSILLRVFLFNRIQVAKKNIKLCFKEMNKQELRGLFKENLQAASLSIFDIGIAWFWSDHRVQHRLSYRIEGLSNLKKSTDGRGVLLLFKHSLHFMLDARILGLHHEIYGVTRDVKNSGYINDLYMKRRLKTCKGVARPHEPLKMIRWLRQGKTLCYAMDHDYGLENALIISFFGAPAATLKAPHKIWQMTQCRICLLDSFYDGQGQLVLKISTYQPQSASEQAETFLQALNDITEAQIRQNPSEYHWYYSRFKSTQLYDKAWMN